MPPISRSDLLRRLLPAAVVSAALFSSLLPGGCKSGNEATTGGGTATTTGGGETTTATAGAKQDMSGDEILIGHYASMTGENSAFGNESKPGADLAIKQINAQGGVLGKQLRLENQDDQSKQEEAKTVATAFASNGKIVAVVGEISSGRSLAAGPVLQRAGIPMVSPASTNPNVTKVGDYIFRVCYIDPFQGYVMAKFAKDDLKATKVAIMRDQGNDYSVGLANVFKEEFPKMGGQIAIDVSYSAKDSDFRSQLAQVKSSGAEAIFIPGYYSEIGTIARQAREQGINAPFLGGDGWDSSKLVEGAGGPGKALEGSFFATHYSKTDKKPVIQKFVEAYRAEYKQDPPSCNTALAYDAVMILADAIKRAGTTERRAVRDALAQTKNFNGVTGQITINAERDATKPAVVLQIKGNDFVYRSTVQPPTSQTASAK